MGRSYQTPWEPYKRHHWYFYVLVGLGILLVLPIVLFLIGLILLTFLRFLIPKTPMSSSFPPIIPRDIPDRIVPLRRSNLFIPRINFDPYMVRWNRPKRRK